MQILFLARLGRFALVFGTGDREDLWHFTSTRGRLYVIVDEGFTPATAGLPRTEATYHQVTPDGASVASSANLLLDPGGGAGSHRGWYMLLDADERVITKAFGASGVLIFSSFQPQIDVELEEGQPICARIGISRNFVVFTYNGNAVADLTGGGAGTPDRYVELEDFVTSPFVEQSQTQNADEDTPEPPIDDASCTENDRLQAISNVLKASGPSNARYGNYYLRLGQRMSKRGLFYPACVPIAVMQRNWREN
jgi:hypothetical protein